MAPATTVYGLPEHIDRLPIAAIAVQKPQSALDYVVSSVRHTYDGSPSLGSRTQKDFMTGISCENLRKRYGAVRALDGVSFVVEPGTVVALLGANGSGKTTTVRILTTLTTPDSGSARIAGLDVIREAPLVRRMIGLTAQETVIDRFLNGREYMQLIAQLRGVPRRERDQEVKALLAEFSLTEIAERRVGTYSGGMRRRLDLASSFIGEPSVLFLDEPSTGLDPHSRQSLWTAIRRRAETGHSVLITTQYMEEADVLADLVVVLAHGRVIATGRADDLKDDIGGRLVELTLEHLSDQQKAARVLADLDIASATSNEHPGVLQFILPTIQPTLHMVLHRLEREAVTVADAVVRRPTLDEVFRRLTATPSSAQDRDPALEKTH